MKTALVIGCAACVWEDLKAAKALGSYDKIYCVKQIGIHYPEKFDVWVTLHPEAMDDYELKRSFIGLPNGYEIVAPPPGELGSHGKKGNIARRVSYLWPGAATNASASSGIYGAKVAMEDGCDRIVLAGIPMTAEGGHFAPDTKNVLGQVRGKVWETQSAFVSGFNESIPRLLGKVKSMSGYTKKVLGEPTSEWLTQ